jgi:hypothetical protein
VGVPTTVALDQNVLSITVQKEFPNIEVIDLLVYQDLVAVTDWAAIKV